MPAWIACVWPTAPADPAGLADPLLTLRCDLGDAHRLVVELGVESAERRDGVHRRVAQTLRGLQDALELLQRAGEIGSEVERQRRQHLCLVAEAGDLVLDLGHLVGDLCHLVRDLHDLLGDALDVDHRDTLSVSGYAWQYEGGGRPGGLGDRVTRQLRAHGERLRRC